jgi:hypothetical protein
MKSETAIAFELRPSRRVAGAVTTLAVLALASILLSGVPDALRIVLALFVVFSVARWWQRQPHRRWRAVTCHGDGGWTLRGAHVADEPAKLQSWRRLGNALVLRIVPAHGPRCDIALLPDSVDADTLRRLRVRLVRGASDAPSDPVLLAS